MRREDDCVAAFERIDGHSDHRDHGIRNRQQTCDHTGRLRIFNNSFLRNFLDDAAIPTRPKPISTNVPGSGTLSGGPHFTFFLPVPPLSVPFFPGAQTPGAGTGGGAMGAHDSPLNGLYKLNGGCGPMPGIPGRSISADWKGTGGPCMAVPSPPPTGCSNFAAGGSEEDVACCGVVSTRFPQRERAVILPSVISFSPLCRALRRVRL